MASTTMDLCAGTTKTTYHTPGYSGHIPSSNRNPNACIQADGAAARKPTFSMFRLKTGQPVSSLRLYHRHNVPGYGGHNPNNASNDKGPRYSGANRLTSSGASTKGEILL